MLKLNIVQGYVKVRPEEDEDMWHLYNLIREVKRIRTTTQTWI